MAVEAISMKSKEDHVNIFGRKISKYNIEFYFMLFFTLMGLVSYELGIGIAAMISWVLTGYTLNEFIRMGRKK
jgi:hypothetical protein